MSDGGANTLAFSRAYSAMGLKGGELPMVRRRTIQPVAVMSDMSRTLSAEPLEARAFVGENVAGVPLRYPAFALHSLAPGGCIVELFRFHQKTLVGVFIQILMAFQLTKTDVWSGWSTADVWPIGGQTVRSIVRVGTSAAAPGPGLGWAHATDGTVDFTGQRIYVPGGSFFNCQAGHHSNGAGIELIWRELQEPIGAP